MQCTLCAHLYPNCLCAYNTVLYSSPVLSEYRCPLCPMNIYLSPGWPDIIALAWFGGTAYYCVLIRHLRVHQISHLPLPAHVCTHFDKPSLTHFHIPSFSICPCAADILSGPCRYGNLPPTFIIMYKLPGTIEK